jgi:dipeptidyl aminopeptidase/acylaminoacyl peptidase
MFRQGRISALLGLPGSLILLGLICAIGLAQEPAHILQHDSLVSRVSISSDGKLIAAGCSNHETEIGSFVLWDAKTGMQVRKLKGYKFSMAGLEFTPDGKHLISAGLAGIVRVTKVSTGEDVSKIENLDSITGFRLLGRSGMLVIYEDTKWSVWDLSDPATPKPAKNPPNFGTYGGRVTFSTDGKVLAGANNSPGLIELPATAPASIWVWDVANGKLLQTFKGQEKNKVMRIRLSSDKRLLGLGYVFGHDNLEVREVKDGKLVFKGFHPDLPASMAFSPDGKYLAVGSAGSGTLHIWSVDKMAITKKIDAHSGTIQCLAFSMDGEYLVSGSADHTVKIWKFINLK